MPVNAVIKRAIQSSRNHEPIISSIPPYQAWVCCQNMYMCSRKSKEPEQCNISHSKRLNVCVLPGDGSVSWWGALTRWAVTKETPVLLSLELGSSVGLPQVVEGREENDGLWVGRESALDRAESSCLVCWRGNCNTIGLTLPWPSGLGDDNILVLVRQDSSECRNLGGEETSRVGCNCVAIKEGVAVDGAVVGGVAKRWVVTCGNEGVDGDDLSSVASGLERGSSSANSSDNFRSRSSTVVDKLIANVDGVKRAPVTISSINNDLDLIAQGAQVKDTSEQLEALVLRSCENGCDLVAVSSIGSNQ